MSDAPSPATLFALLSDETTRRILTETDRKPMPAKSLSERCDASLPTVYRRIDRLKAHGLLAEDTRLDADGNHYSVYEARLDSLHVTLSHGEFEVAVGRDGEDAADRFTEMWEGLR